MSIENRGFYEPVPESRRPVRSPENVTIELMEEALMKMVEAKKKINELRGAGDTVEDLWSETERLEKVLAEKLMEIPKTQEEIDEQRTLYKKITEKYIEMNLCLDKASDASHQNQIKELKNEISETKKKLGAIFELLYPPEHPERN